MRTAGDEDVAQAADVLARAFATDPPFVAALGHPDEPQRLLRCLYASLLRHHYLSRGAVDVAVDGDEVMGVAVWGAPGRGALPLGAKARIAREVLPVYGLRAIRLLRQERIIAAHYPPGEYWYLFAIGVGVPGRGVGGLLLDHGVARATEHGCYLEASTPSSARLYERKGFVRRGDVEVEGGPLVRMWREPAPVNQV
ncbi:GCN5-like N-acetyltransferase [Mobilicoccus caccae]|uniref:GCN5-like N-acetyltransferase n=1 Tax=Mobilicoccus caccae TaxID=1859295 RepID=A0ABQ6IJN1_9MICO|nr:GCN5-like N-acetyltransferase [Mobilicoccus caccae]